MRELYLHRTLGVLYCVGMDMEGRAERAIDRLPGETMDLREKSGAY